jgi:hypothetical protein
LFFQVKSQLHNALFLSTTEIFAQHALVVVLKPHAVEFLPQFSVFEFGLKSFGFFLESVVIAVVMKGDIVESKLGTSLGAGLIVFLQAL